MLSKVSILFDKRKVLTTGPDKGRCHVKLVGSFYNDGVRIRRYYKTGIFMTEEEYNKVISGKTGKVQGLSDKQSSLFNLLEKAKEIQKANQFIDADSFEYELTNAGSFKDPLSLMESYAKELREAGRVGNAEYYIQARSSFLKFMDGRTLSFAMVTPKWLHGYERWMTVDNKKSITTVGMYCIAMRTIFNLAIEKRKISDKLYPFGKGKYVIPTSKGRKLALSVEQKDSVLGFKTLNPLVRKAVDLWIFSYLCYGINFADIARLKFGDIKGDQIIFDRTKTINTSRDRSFLEIPVRPEAWQIIKDHGNYTDSMNPNAYVFPILRDGLTPEQMHDRVHDFIKDTNAGLEIASNELGLPRITTYWARHTFATIAFKKGAGIEFIQKALGHSDPKTTQRYIQSFDIETKRMVSNWL